MDEVYEEYVNQYGKDNADHLMSILHSWQQHYSRAAYIDMGFVNDSEYEQKARSIAQDRGWSFQRLHGDRTLINKLLWGEWNAKDFLVVPPGHTIEGSTDPQAIVQAKAEKRAS